tara:strand:- start:2591 stop:3286 length:696 start_codon:yes stop_codon:yes gene_type:complete
MNGLQSVFIVPIFLALYGCGGVAKIPISVFGDKDHYAAGLQEKYKDKTYLDTFYSCSTDACQLTERNRFINELLFLMDYNYNRYTGNIIAGKAKGEFGVGLTDTLLSLAATVSTVETAKTAYAAVATAVGSGKTEFDSAYYAEKTTSAIVTQMDALRTTARVPLEAGLRTSKYTNYPISRAMADLNYYYYAGTMSSAIIALGNTAAANVKLAEQEASTKINEQLNMLEAMP